MERATWKRNGKGEEREDGKKLVKGWQAILEYGNKRQRRPESINKVSQGNSENEETENDINSK